MCSHIRGTADTRFVTTTAWSASSIDAIAEWPVRTGAMAAIRIAMAIATDAPELRCRPRQVRRRVTPRPVMRLLVTSEQGPLDAPAPHLHLADTYGPDKSWADSAPAEPVQRRKSHIAAVAGNRSLVRRTVALAESALGKYHGRNDRNRADSNQGDAAAA